VPFHRAAGAQQQTEGKKTLSAMSEHGMAALQAESHSVIRIASTIKRHAPCAVPSIVFYVADAHDMDSQAHHASLTCEQVIFGEWLACILYDFHCYTCNSD
jgi:hypothetical protein